MNVVADSSFLVALFYPNDVHHIEAKKILEKTDSILIHIDLLKEALTVLMYKLGPKTTAAVYENIIDNEVFAVESFGLDEVFGFWLSLERKISYFDALAIFLALKTGLPLVSFDVKQKRLFNAIKRRLGKLEKL